MAQETELGDEYAEKDSKDELEQKFPRAMTPHQMKQNATTAMAIRLQ